MRTRFPSLGCGKAHARGGASEGDHFAGKRNHCAVNLVEMCFAMSLRILMTEI